VNLRGVRSYPRRRLSGDLRRLGLPEGSTVLVHASMREVRPVRRDPAVLADALLRVLGPKGTLVVPAYTTWNSTSSPAYRAATEGMTPEQIFAYQAQLSPFDVATTPAWRMGRLAEYVRTRPNSARSSHPQSSFAAVGERAAEMMNFHDRDCHLGERSPLGALHAQDAFILMLGTSYSTSSVFHLAETQYAQKPLRSYECRIAGETANPNPVPQLSGWTSFEDIDYDDSDFHLLGRDFESTTDDVSVGRVGGALSRLYRVRSAVTFAKVWLSENRD
jgi:aminoglycoside 3-N-acetyltransferase